MAQESRIAQLRPSDLARYAKERDPFAGRSSEVIDGLTPQQKAISTDLLAAHRKTLNPNGIKTILVGMREQVSLRARLTSTDDAQMVEKLVGELAHGEHALIKQLTRTHRDPAGDVAINHGYSLIDTFGTNHSDAATILGKVLDIMDATDQALQRQSVPKIASINRPIKQRVREPEEPSSGEFPLFYR